MILTHDVFAEINPAYCSTVLGQFCGAYSQNQKDGIAPAIAIVYVVLPIVLSEDLASAFDGCNKNTGLLVWLNRSPKVLVELTKRVNATLEITTAAIRFGCLTGKLSLTNNGELASSSEIMPKAVSNGIASASLKRAKILGSWFASMGSPRSVFEALGISV